MPADPPSDAPEPKLVHPDNDQHPYPTYMVLPSSGSLASLTAHSFPDDPLSVGMAGAPPGII